MIIRKGPDGQIYKFPEGTSEQEMIDAFVSVYGDPEQDKSLFETIGDFGADVGRGLTSTLQGISAGGFDEVAGALSGWAAEKAQEFMPSHVPYSLDPEKVRSEIPQYVSSELEQFGIDYPSVAFGTEVAGSIFSPVAKVTRLGQLTKFRPTGKAALDSMGFAMPYAFLSADGDLVERAESAASVAIPAALFGAGGEKAYQFSKGAFDKIFKKSFNVPTVQNLEEAKRLAYAATEELGETYNPNEVRKMVSSAAKKLSQNQSFNADIDKQAAAAFDLLKKQLGKDITLTQLDKVRKGLWMRHKAGTDTEKEIIRDIIDTIDDTMFSHSATTESMMAARLANSRFKKAELLDEVFRKAELQTASTGSGGNILNKYKQAVTGILTNKKNSRWFTPEEIKQMESFVRGDMSQDTMRLIGKLSPSGNGLMTALNIGAIATDPAMAAVTVAGAASKAAADRDIMKQKQVLESVIRGQPMPVPQQSQFVAPVTGGILGQLGE